MSMRTFFEKIGLLRPKLAAPETPRSAPAEGENLPAAQLQGDDEFSLADNMGDIVPRVLEMPGAPPETQTPPEEPSSPTPAPFRQPRVAISLLKGGVGKTTITCFLATALQKKWDETNEEGRVLVVDTDPQGSATSFFLNGAPVEPQHSLRALFPPYLFPGDGLIHRTRYPRIDILPAHPEMADVTVPADAPNEENLARYLAAAADAYRLILIDTPPSDTLALRNALMASSGVYAPLDPSRQALNTLVRFQKTIERYKALNSVLSLYGVIYSRCYMAQNLDKEIYNNIREILASSGLPLYVLPRRQALAECFNDNAGFEALDPVKEKEAVGTLGEIAHQMILRSQ